MKKYNWKKPSEMQPGDSHIHESWISNPGAIRYSKGHYVNRPYLEYASSKWEANYIDFYDIILNHLKYRSDVTLLEFGVFTGESIRYFRDYFIHPDAKIVGFDHQACEFYGHDWHAECKGISNHDSAGEEYTGPTHNVIFHKGEQRNSNDIYDVCNTHGPFDVIVDDACHDPQITEDVWRIAWKYLKENGIYLIEDISVADIGHLVNEVTVTKQGRGVICKPSGFGPGLGGGECVCLVLLKSKDSITGLDTVLVE